MVPETVNPLLWYVCKFCRRAYQLRGDLVAHKKSNHLQLFLQDLTAKRRAREGALSAGSSTDGTSSASYLTAQDSSNGSENESVDSEEGSSTSATEIDPSLPKPKVGPPLVKSLDYSIIEPIPSVHENSSNHAMDTFYSAPSSPTEPSKFNQDANQSIINDPNKPENIPQDKSRYWTSTPRPSHVPPESPKKSQDGDDTNSMDEFVTSSQTGRPLLKCNQCDRMFKQEHSRKLHIAHVHDKDRRYPCQFCPKVFTHPRSRVFHVTREHVDRNSRLILAKSVEECSVGPASRTTKRGRTKPQAPVSGLKNKRSRPNHDEDLSVESKQVESSQSDSSKSNLYECQECDDTFGSMSELCLHKSYHKRKSARSMKISK